jgi:hypothetical protein
MAQCINEPQKIIAGFGTEWTRVLSDFPTAAFTLNYRLRPIGGTGAVLDLTAQPDGFNGYKTTITPTQSSTLSAVEYRITGFITDDETGGQSVKQVVYDGRLTVVANPTASGDQRSTNRRILDSLKATMETLSTKRLTSMSANGKSYTMRDIPQLFQDIQRYEQLVKQEEEAETLTAACKNPRNIYVRHTYVR